MATHIEAFILLLTLAQKAILFRFVSCEFVYLYIYGYLHVEVEVGSDGNTSTSFLVIYL